MRLNYYERTLLHNIVDSVAAPNPDTPEPESETLVRPENYLSLWGSLLSPSHATSLKKGCRLNLELAGAIRIFLFFVSKSWDLELILSSPSDARTNDSQIAASFCFKAHPHNFEGSSLSFFGPPEVTRRVLERRSYIFTQDLFPRPGNVQIAEKVISQSSPRRCNPAKTFLSPESSRTCDRISLHRLRPRLRRRHLRSTTETPDLVHPPPPTTFGTGTASIATFLHRSRRVSSLFFSHIFFFFVLCECRCTE